MARIEWDRLAGMTYAEAWEAIQSRFTRTLLNRPTVVE
jgi:hypothetical protein